MKQFALIAYCLFTFAIIAVESNGSPGPPPGTIQIPATRGPINTRQSESYHRKQQQPRSYTLNGFSETFVKLPGTTLEFIHTEPLLYKVRFEGKCYTPDARGIWLYLHLMVDDSVLYVDKFLPNTAERYKYNTGYSTNDASDSLGGFYWHANSPTVTTCAFTDIIDRKSTRLNSSHITPSRMPSSA